MNTDQVLHGRIEGDNSVVALGAAVDRREVVRILGLRVPNMAVRLHVRLGMSMGAH